MTYSVYIGMGDSISIDYYTGIPYGGGISLFYRNLDDMYPDFRGRDLVSLFPGIECFNIAVDGERASGMAGQLEILTNIARKKGVGDRALVTLTIGGNDILAFINTRYFAGRSFQSRLDMFLLELQNRINNILSEIRDAFNNDVDIIIGSIYDPTDGSGILYGMDISSVLSSLEEINEAIMNLGVRHGAAFADIHNHFLGHGNGTDDCWYTGEIEPNSKGGSEVRRVFWETLTGRIIAGTDS